MTDPEPNLPALRREWLAARVMAVIGVLLLLAVAVLIGVSAFYGPPATPTATPVTASPPAAPDTAQARRQEDIALCDAALATVQTLGLVPAFAARDGDSAAPGNVQGRYICHARTGAARYTLIFDLACTHLGDAKCIVPITISQDPGGVLYQRP